MVWKILVGFFAGALYLGIFLFLIILLALGYFTYKNLSKNKQKAEEKSYARVTRVEALYRSIVNRLNDAMGSNQISAEELLQSEILITENLGTIRNDLIQLKEFASMRNQKELSAQLREYQNQLRESRDSVSREVLEQNLKMVEQKRERMDAALEEIRQKEGLVDLVYNSLVNVEEDLKFGRPVQRLFQPELYRRFGLNPPAEQPALPPLMERSDE
jgi:predicted negative regulator of RcsB-dependent stress response